MSRELFDYMIPRVADPDARRVLIELALRLEALEKTNRGPVVGTPNLTADQPPEGWARLIRDWGARLSAGQAETKRAERERDVAHGRVESAEGAWLDAKRDRDAFLDRAQRAEWDLAVARAELDRAQETAVEESQRANHAERELQKAHRALDTAGPEILSVIEQVKGDANRRLVTLEKIVELAETPATSYDTLVNRMCAVARMELNLTRSREHASDA